MPLLCFAIAFALTAVSWVGAQEPVSWEEINRLSARAPDARIAYGKEPAQFGELRLPPGAGPHPVAVVIHGGCWRREFDLQHAAPMAAALAQAGIATWTIEYRRLGETGGGWPGTFEDVAAAIDQLSEISRQHPLDLARLILIGHSAGGQLALWAGVRHPVAGSPRRATLPVRGVIALAAITDLRAYSGSEGCNAAVGALLGGTPEEVPERYAAASPIALLPLGVPVRMLHGALDPIVPLEQSRTFASRAAGAGERTELRVIEHAGHFDFLAPSTPAFAAVLEAVRELIRAR